MIEAINNMVFPTAEWIIFAFTLHWTLSRAQRKVSAGIIVLLTIILLAFAVYSVFPPINFVVSFVQVYFVSTAACLIYKAPPYVAAFFCIAVYYISMVADMLMGNLLMAVYQGDIISVLSADPLLRFIFNTAAKLIQILISVSMIKGFRNIHWEIPAIYWLTLDTILVLDFLCVLGYAQATPYLQTQMTPWHLFAGMLLFFTSNILTAVLFAAISNHYSKKQLLYIAKQTQARLDNDMLSFEKEKAATRKIRHDQANALNNLALMIRENELPEALEYIAGLTDRMPSADVDTITGISGIDAMISMKREAATAQQIRFQVHSESLPPCGFSIVSVATVLSNLLDNAIEGNAEVDAASRYIQLKCYVNGHMLNIVVANPYKVAPLQINNRLISRKADLESHGYGTSIVREICEERKGHLVLKYDDGVFTAHASMLTEKEGI